MNVIQTPVVLKRVHPAYPVDAMTAGIQGTVELEVIIGPEGTVRDARVTKSIPELDDAALAAIREWKFKPFSGDPVRRTLELSFTLRRE